MPSKATANRATALRRATPRPANCQAMRKMMPIIARIGILLKPCSTQESVPSIGARSIWKKGRKFSTTQPRPWLIQSSTGSSLLLKKRSKEKG